MLSKDLIVEIAAESGRIFSYALLGIFLYYITISAFAWVRRKEAPAIDFAPVKKFAVLVAAHNEEQVIRGILHSLKKLNYPKELYEIFVIADNCTDNTARISRELGAKVYERFDNVKRGKGYSLEWMFKKLFDMEEEYDAVCILDADNLVSTNFLLEMNKQLCQGHEVVQGYLDSKNPLDTWISG
ncbi:MAG: glycosyltransferase family 2 protein, partial [Clostridia bacterium]|nr:glycosyltransferase family 2 protein [Clostridia bacterium]